MPGSTAVCHESGYLLSPPSHLHAFQWLPLLIDSLLPLAHQPASFLFIFSSTVLHFIVFFRGDITSVVIISSLFFSFPLNKTFYLFFRACFLFASFINVASVVQSSSRSCQSIYKFFNSYLLSCFVIRCTLVSNSCSSFLSSSPLTPLASPLFPVFLPSRSGNFQSTSFSHFFFLNQ